MMAQLDVEVDGIAYPDEAKPRTLQLRKGATVVGGEPATTARTPDPQRA
jgi:hypothetical protein